MSFGGNRINTNVPAQFAQRILAGTQNDISKNLQRLASALRVNSASDDAAAFAVGQQLETQTRGFNQAIENVQDGASAAQVAEGGIQAVNDSVQRIRELSVQAANGTLTDADRALIQEEISEIKAEIDRFAPTVTFNGKPLLTGDFAEGTGDFVVQSGANKDETVSVNFEEVNTTTLGIAGVDVSTQAGAQNAIEQADTALASVNSSLADIGASQNRLSATSDFLGIARENSLAAQSRIQDADIATEIVGLTLNQIKQQSGTAALSQANLSPQRVLQLLG